MPKPSSSALSDAGPQSMADVWTTSGTSRRRMSVTSPLNQSHRRGLQSAGASQEEDERRDLLDRDLHCSSQTMLDFDSRVTVHCDRQLNAHAIVSNLVRHSEHG